MAKVQGLAEAYSTLDQAPQAAREQLAVEMAIVGREILAAQRADAARDTGALEAALSLQVLLEQLRVKIGLLIGGRSAGRFNGRARKAVAGGPFYGRFVEFGRRAQTVLVTRRVKQRKIRGNGRTTARRVVYGGGKARLRRRGPNRGTPIGSPYKMAVRARAEHPFVAQPLLAEVAERHLGEYWSRVLARAGGA